MLEVVLGQILITSEIGKLRDYAVASILSLLAPVIPALRTHFVSRFSLCPVIFGYLMSVSPYNLTGSVQHVATNS